MVTKSVLHQWLCESIHTLILGLDQEYLYQSLLYRLTEVVIAHIDVLCLWMLFWQADQLKSSVIVLEDFAVDMGVDANYLEAMSIHLL